MHSIRYTVNSKPIKTKCVPNFMEKLHTCVGLFSLKYFREAQTLPAFGKVISGADDSLVVNYLHRSINVIDLLNQTGLPCRN